MVKKNKVICICRGIGFPYGLAQTHRIRMVGRAVLAEGLDFTVLHIGGSPTDHNRAPSGDFQGIRFDYLPPRTEKPANPVARKLGYLWGTLLAVAKVRTLRASTLCVYAWVGRGAYGIVLKLALKMLGVPVVQEVNEWWPGRLEWVRNTVNLALCDGTVAISKEIEARLKGLCSTFRLSHEIARVPVLADAEEYLPGGQGSAETEPYVLWCGNLEAYPADVEFMLKALRAVLDKGVQCTLVLVGKSSERVQSALSSHLKWLGLREEDVRVTGYVSDEELRSLMCGARALLLPLWDDDRSRCRFPNKVGEYLFSRRPVITCAMGDIVDFLADGSSAHVCTPGDVEGFAKRICRVLENPAEAELMSARGRDQAVGWLDWRGNAGKISRLFTVVSAPARGGKGEG